MLAYGPDTYQAHSLCVYILRRATLPWRDENHRATMIPEPSALLTVEVTPEETIRVIYVSEKADNKLTLTGGVFWTPRAFNIKRWAELERRFSRNDPTFEALNSCRCNKAALLC